MTTSFKGSFSYQKNYERVESVVTSVVCLDYLNFPGRAYPSVTQGEKQAYFILD